MPPDNIAVNEDLINDIAQKLLLLRSETSVVRNGSNPTDPGHPSGFPLNRVDVLAGGTNWPSGADLKAKLLAIGQQLDGHFVAMDHELDHYVQVLQMVLRDSDDTENENIGYTDFML